MVSPSPRRGEGWGDGPETLWGGGVVSCVGGGVNIPHHHAHKKGDWVGLYDT